MRRFVLLSAAALILSACAVDQAETNKNASTSIVPSSRAGKNMTYSDTVLPVAPTYSTNGSYDDNGAEPAPNNGSQNFGRRW